MNRNLLCLLVSDLQDRAKVRQARHPYEKIMIKLLKYIPITLMLYIACCMLRLYPVDLLDSRSVTFDINGLYGFPIPFLTEFHVSTNVGDFQNRDSLINGKFNSRDIKAYLSEVYKNKKRTTCTALVSGGRVYSPSYSPNILSIKCI